MKENKVLYVVIMILIGIICLGGGYFLGQNHFSDNDNKKNPVDTPQDQPNQPAEVSKEISEDVRTILLKQIKERYSYFGYLGRNLNQMNELSDMEVLRFAVKAGEHYNDKWELAFESIQDMIRHYLKIDRSIDSSKVTDIVCSLDKKPLFDYDVTTDTPFFADGHFHGSSEGEDMAGIASTRYVGSSVKDNIYTIDVYLLFVYYGPGVSGGSRGYYSSWPTNTTSVIFTDDDVNKNSIPSNEEISNYFNQYTENLPKYTYTFEKDGNHYRLLSYKVS